MRYVGRMLSQQIVDVIRHPTAHNSRERTFVANLVEQLIGRPLSTEDAADVLGVSKPTVLKWLRFGLLREAAESTPKQRQLDAAVVYGAKRLLAETKAKGTVSQRADMLAAHLGDLAEMLAWNARPEARASLDRALRQLAAGDTVPVTNEELKRGRELLARRRLARRRRSR